MAAPAVFVFLSSSPRGRRKGGSRARDEGKSNIGEGARRGCHLRRRDQGRGSNAAEPEAVGSKTEGETGAVGSNAAKTRAVGSKAKGEPGAVGSNI